jgi:hypothetical protein
MKKMKKMKQLMLVVACVSAALHVNADFFGLYNNTRDSFIVERHSTCVDAMISDSKYRSNEIKNTEILGGTNLLYYVAFPNCYKHTHDSSFLSFRNGEYEFRVRFPESNIAMLDSDTATELHNDVEKDSTNYYYIGDCNSMYIGHVLNWLIVGPYRVVHFLEKSGRGRSFVIEYATDDNAWMTRTEEDLALQYTPPKRHWWSKLCSCSNCDD